MKINIVLNTILFKFQVLNIWNRVLFFIRNVKPFTIIKGYAFWLLIYTLFKIVKTRNADKNLLSVSYLRFSFNEIETLNTNTSMCSCLCFRYTHHIDMIRDLSPEHITRKDIWFAIDMFVMSCYVCKHFLFINISFYLCFCYTKKNMTVKFP